MNDERLRIECELNGIEFTILHRQKLSVPVAGCRAQIKSVFKTAFSLLNLSTFSSSVGGALIELFFHEAALSSPKFKSSMF